MPVATSLADRAARYNRHRSPLDDRPVAQQAPAAAAAVPTRSLPPARTPARPLDEPPVTRQETRPPPLDMAAIAARNRQARVASRDDRPVVPPTPAPAPRPVRTTIERTTPVTQDRPTPTPVSMQDRARRHNALLRDKDDAPLTAPKTPIPQRVRPQPAPDDQEMVARAAEATRRRRDKLGGAIVVETPADVGVQHIHLPTTAFVLVSRNDGGRVVSRMQAWRAVLQATDVRWWLLDLGSVDESVTAAEAVHAQVLTVPGGLVTPLQTLDQVVQRVDADVIVVAEADAYPDGTVTDLLTRVRGGAALAVPERVDPRLLVLSRAAWDRRSHTESLDLSAWSGQPLPGSRPLLDAAPTFIPRLLHAPLARVAWQRVAPWVAQAQKLALPRHAPKLFG